MDPTQEIKQILGDMAMQIAVLQCELRLRNAQLEAQFQAVNDCILSGQIPDDRVQALIANTPGFAEWRNKHQKQHKENAIQDRVDQRRIIRGG